MDIKTNWFKSAVIYQIYPLSFKDSNGDGYGDLPGIIEKLPYIKSLGVDALWICPFYKSPLKDFGYDVTDHFEVDPIFGYMFDFEKLVSESHKLGLKVLIDLVLNHTSSDHEWFKESRSSKSSSKRDWYVWRSGKGESGSEPPNNWTSVFGGSAWTRDEITGEWYLHTFFDNQPDLNWRNEEVKGEMYKVIDFWLTKGVDGFRGDALHHLFEDGDFADEEVNSYFKPGFDNPYNAIFHSRTEGLPETIKMILDISDHIKKFGDTVFVTEAYLDLEGLLHVYKNCPIDNHMPFNFNLLSLPWDAGVYKNFMDRYIGENPEFPKNYVLGNHDRHRVVSRVGKDKSLALALTTLTLPGSAFIYYGEEIGMENLEILEAEMEDNWGKRIPGMNLGRDPERGVMQWSEEEFAGFGSEKPWIGVPQNQNLINVEVEEKDPNSVLNFYKKLLVLRKEDIFREGEYIEMPVESDTIFQFKRKLGDREVLVAVNMGEKEASLPSAANAKGFISSVLPNLKTARLASSPGLHPPTSASAPLLPNEGRIIFFY